MRFAFWKSFSLIQTGIAALNERKPRGALAREVASSR
jgi:hypothetical protein